MIYHQRRLISFALPLLVLLWSAVVQADPVSTTPRFTFAGNLDFTVTGGTLRAADNSTNACSLVSPRTSTAQLSVPVGATVIAAYLYWAGSGPDPDYQVTFNGQPISFPDRTFTDSYQTFEFFSGFHDVTPWVVASGNNTFADLDVTIPSAYCTSQAVLAGWGLVVVYERASEPFRVINIFDGFEPFRGSQILLTPGNFLVPGTPDGKLGVLSWEGDVQNSSAFNGVTENITFRGEQQGVETSLLDPPLNPVNNQFNSTVSGLSAVPDTVWGVDFDLYDITTLLTPGDRSGTTRYSSGGDLVLLSAQIISVTNTPVVDLTLTKTHAGDFSINDEGVYQLIVGNEGPLPHSGLIQVVDQLPGTLSFVSATSTDPDWNCLLTSPAAPQEVTCSHPGALPVGATLAPIELRVATPGSAGSLSNQATVTGSQFEFELANNTARDATTLGIADLSTSVKSVVDLNGGVPAAGDRVRYEITVRESQGVGLYGLVLDDVIDPALTNVVVTDSGGGTDVSLPGSGALRIIDLPVLPGGSTTVVFEADIVAGAPLGTAIRNTAELTNPGDGSVTQVSAPELVVGIANPPAAGIKPIYLGNFAGSTNSPVLPMPMGRTPLTAPAAATRVRIRRQDDDRVWRLTPQLAGPLALSSDPIPVYLQMQRSNNGSVRDLRISLRYSGPVSGFLGCMDVAIAGSGSAGLSSSQTREFVFPVPRSDGSCTPIGGAPLILPPGTVLELLVDNDPAGGSGRSVYVYPYNPDTGATSRLELDTSTVINVDSVAAYDSAFPGGSPQAGFDAGDTLYLRAVVSDPFGSFDISGATLSLFDGADSPVQSVAMTGVASDALTRTFEASYVIPANAVPGAWRFEVVAEEGTEGTVQHLYADTFPVAGSSDIQIDKTVVVLSDGSGAANPKFLPGALVEYQLVATNLGTAAADADSVVIVDSFPPGLQLDFGSAANPVPLVFEQGAPASGLTYTYGALGDGADDVAFSNDGGTTFITPTVGADGLDATIPAIDLIQVSPKGIFAPASGAGQPQFIIRLRARVR